MSKLGILSSSATCCCGCCCLGVTGTAEDAPGETTTHGDTSRVVVLLAVVDVLAVETAHVEPAEVILDGIIAKVEAEDEDNLDPGDE